MEQVRQGSATTTHAVRAAKQRSQASLAQLSREAGINPKTVAKWRKRATVEDMKTGPSEPGSIVLTEDKEAMIVAFSTGQPYRLRGEIAGSSIGRLLAPGDLGFLFCAPLSWADMPAPFRHLDLGWPQHIRRARRRIGAPDVLNLAALRMSSASHLPRTSPNSANQSPTLSCAAS
ncbi:hypothetical protein [Paracoccus sp. S1E-3]|uniref:hypothetical protein n=1 Tax=Paracoccus sp. S1E-3 TaxID=2756130 RepID=UPI002107133A|nr:hypothetical protein [Paracoccus sp. S1E-3]